MDDEESKALLEKDPGNTVFVEYAESLRLQGQHESAVIVCLRGLSVNPDNHRGRLVLAHTLYQMRCVPFVIEQLRHLASALPEDPVIPRLLAKLTQTPTSGDDSNENTTSEAATQAEAEFDFDEIDMLNEE